MKYFFFSLLFAIKLFADEPMIQPLPFEIVKSEIAKKESVLLEFGSTSCNSCVIMGKTLYKIKQKYPQSHIYFIDLYKDMEIAKKYGVRMIPTQVYLDKEGEVIERHIGIIEEKELITKLKNLDIVK